MKEGQSMNEYPAYVKTSQSNSRIIIIFVSIIILVLLIGAVLYFIGLQSKKKQPSSQVAIVHPTPTVTQTPVATTTATLSTTPSLSPNPTKESGALDRSALTVSVLNGSGVKGAANSVSSTLKELGYDVQTVGNADSFTYTNIVIKVKKSRGIYVAQLKKDLTSNLQSSSISATLTDDIPTDAVVIVGK